MAGETASRKRAMQKLLAGIHKFQSNVFGEMREFFEGLSHGQRPEALFITCSDSRINPNLLTQTEPGELFILRNAGNIVPPYGASGGGEAATIEFALAGLGVKHVIVCGHSHCGAMAGLLAPETLEELPSVRGWLSHAEATRRIMNDKYGDRTGAARLTTTIQENVLIQLENLKTHPTVASGLARGELKLHGWVYKLETGEVFEYSQAQGQFVPLAGSSRDPQRPHRSVATSHSI
jgi:carbonic anhydrase